jgi:2Fe-2S ferredoxin
MEKLLNHRMYQQTIPSSQVRVSQFGRKMAIWFLWVLGFELNHDCGGNASCTTCRVEVQLGGENLSEIDFDEQDLLDREALSEPWHRLGCQAKVLGDVVVRVPETKWVQPTSASSSEIGKKGVGLP